MGLPDRKIYVQKPKETRLLSTKANKALELLPESDWIYQTKHDGCSMMILVGVNIVRIFSREGKECFSMPHVAEAVRLRSAPNMVYFAEAWHPDVPFAEVSGEFRRGAAKAEGFLEAWLYDSVTLQEFRLGVSERPYSERYAACTEMRWSIHDVADKDMIQVVPCADVVTTLAENVEHIRKTYGLLYQLDGYMKKQRNAGWVAGDDSEGRTLKLKDKISVDLKCVGFVEGKGKFAGMVGAPLVEWRGDVVPIGGGKLTNDDRRNPERFVGKIVEVHALTITPDGQLREPVYQRVRDDKTEPSE
jgi:DNA ligase-1